MKDTFTEKMNALVSQGNVKPEDIDRLLNEEKRDETIEDDLVAKINAMPSRDHSLIMSWNPYRKAFEWI
jgi:D-hexose-6-phosphate mutarotase